VISGIFSRLLTILCCPLFLAGTIMKEMYVKQVQLHHILRFLFVRGSTTSPWSVDWAWTNSRMSTSSSNYRRLQILQSKCLRVIGNYPRRTLIPRLHATLNVAPIPDFIYHLTANIFDSSSAHPKPLVLYIGNNSLADLHHQYKKYIHNRPKHLLL